ncbi:MAG: hypothetical protein ACYDD0_01045 [Candidatus Dormibacteria bacterium]
MPLAYPEGVTAGVLLVSNPGAFYMPAVQQTAVYATIVMAGHDGCDLQR